MGSRDKRPEATKESKIGKEKISLIEFRLLKL